MTLMEKAMLPVNWEGVRSLRSAAIRIDDPETRSTVDLLVQVLESTLRDVEVLQTALRARFQPT